MRRRGVWSFLVVLAFVAGGCGDSDDSGTAGGGKADGAVRTVDVVDFLYKPETVDVKVGESVTWRFKDAAPHTTTAEDKSFDSDTKRKGESWTYTFSEAGTFPYICTLHPNMKGKVVVS